MKNLQIDEKNARKLFNAATPEFKQTLIDTFGADFFAQKITDRVKTFEDACEIVGVGDNLKILLDYNGTDKILISAQAHAKIAIIVQALNEKWVPDWNNSNELKYEPIFDMRSGSGLAGTDVGGWGAGASVGSRLCFKSRQLAEYAATQFVSIYKYLLT